MRRFGILLGSAAVLIICATLVAGQQPGGKGGKGGKGKGGFGRGGFGGGFGGFRNDPVQLLNNASVKKELDLTSAQTEKIPDAVRKALKDVLSDKQYNRLRQIELQQKGNNAFKDSQVQKELNLSDEQVKNIDSILADAAKEQREMFQGGAGGGFDGIREKLEGLRKETNEKVRGVLSDSQKKTWRVMIGPEFKMERGFGGGGFGKKGGKKGGFKKKNPDQE